MAFQYPLIGGILIGLATSFFLMMNGRLVGISGIIGRLFKDLRSERYWRLIFILGLLFGGFVMLRLCPQWRSDDILTTNPVLFLGAILVGFGSRLGSGCTSGHGVCGISRGSKRSILATILFMLSAALTVFVMKRINL